jgi:hypothetical protein
MGCGGGGVVAKEEGEEGLSDGEATRHAGG